MDTRIKLLMVEDDIVDVMAFKRMVKREKLNYEFKIADAISDAKEYLESENFDIVVTDYQVVDGVFFDLFGVFLQKDIPFICVTGAGDEEIAVKALKAGAYDYLIKDQDRRYLKILPLTIRKAIQRKRSKEQIDLLQSIVVNSNEGIVVSEIQGSKLIITYANDAFYDMSKYSQSDLIGESLRVFYGARTDENEQLKLRQAVINATGLKTEIILYKKDKKAFWANINLLPLKDEKRNTTQFVIMLRDVTEKKQSERAIIEAKNIAEQAQLAEQRFLANISHEIRTPMNAIMGMTNLLEETNPSDKQLEYLQVLKQSSSSLLHLISDVLDLSKIEAGKLEIHEQQFNLFEMLIELQQKFTNIIEDKDLQIVMDVDLDIANDLIGDPIRLNQILTNLLDNAIRFSDEGEIGVKIILQEEKDGKYFLEFQVFDSGKGMSQDEVEIVFNHFKQAHQRIYRKFGGTGLGVAIVKRLVELQGGKIWVKTQQDIGTTFHFTLAFKNTGIPSKVFEEEMNLESKNKLLLKLLRILVVEDNPMSQKLLSEMINHWGSDYDVVGNGQEALKLFEQNNYDVILMDVNMPVMDGYEATKRIRNHEWAANKDIPIIALTAAVISSEINKIYDVGMNLYLSKPIDANILKRTVIDILSNKSVDKSIPSSDATIIVQAKEDGTVFHIGEEKTIVALNLEYLRNFSGGDVNFMKEMMTMFLHQVPDEITQMLDYLNTKNWDELGKLAHKMKPNFLMMGLDEQQLIAKEIEIMCKTGNIEEEHLSILTEQLVEDAFQSLPLVEETVNKL